VELKKGPLKVSNPLLLCFELAAFSKELSIVGGLRLSEPGSLMDLGVCVLAQISKSDSGSPPEDRSDHADLQSFILSDS